MNSVLPFCPPNDNDPLPPAEKPPNIMGGPRSAADPNLLELALAEALAEYRYRAEDILEEHQRLVDEEQGALRHEIASLRAENSKLREALTLQRPMEVELFQNVCFEPSAAQVAAQKKLEKEETIQKVRGGGTKNRGDEDANNGDMGGMKRMKTSANLVSGGSWQQFVAWVPTGAALQNPQPWKPLPGLENTLPCELAAKDSQSEEEEGDSQGSQHFKLLETWVVTDEERARAERRRKRSANGNQIADGESEFGGNSEPGDDVFINEHRDRCTIHPHSNLRIFWDLASLGMVLYDMVMIPMSFFPLPENQFLIMMLWTTRFFWTIDMFVSCTTGIVMPNGAVKLELKFIVRRYVRTWFCMDLVIVGSDWGTFLLSQSGGAGFVTRFSRAFRAVRAVRLLRLARMKDVMTSITERIQSDTLAFMMKIWMMVAFIIASAHIVACIWFAIGSKSEESWVGFYDLPSKAVGVQYLLCLHWALSQFTGGMDELRPINAGERMYAMLIWLFSFLAASVIISILTSELTQMHIVGGNVARQMATLRKYLKQNSISSNLALRMQRSAQHTLSGDLKPELVDLLDVVSEPLRVEMHFEMYGDTYRKHPFFSDFIIEHPLIMRRVSHYATSTLILSMGDAVFSEGETPSHPCMFFVQKGTLEYQPEASEAVTLAEGQFVSEAALWTAWTYQGTLTALVDSKCAVLSAKSFQDIVGRFKDTTGAGFDPKEYAARFVQMLNDHDQPDDLTKLNYYQN
eukprot:TRINITY_DN18914_c0_g2_i1.p1 TRINITY_DN18914_c0_g2~~TRINITY_DN18914_c0_g2_i1.p1  ORF type:complete len:745 (+),score=165.27 TRINITY_DN18914_c0_g2_i1:105-2339(+)